MILQDDECFHLVHFCFFKKIGQWVIKWNDVDSNEEQISTTPVNIFGWQLNNIYTPERGNRKKKTWHAYYNI